MSVIIKGMEMPKSCAECFLRDGLFCAASDYKRISYGGLDKKEDWCPLAEVKTPHGRLIDADELKKEYPHDTDWEYPVNTNEYVNESIDNALTVIEAENEVQEW